MYEVALGGATDEISCAEVAATTKTAYLPPCLPSPDNWLIPSGYGTLVASLATGLPIALNTTVETIRWGSKSGVALDTSNGTVVAKKVIVTSPIGVLAAGLPEFVPALPPRFDEALNGLGMGTDEKIALLFKPGYQFPVPADNTFVYPNINTRKVPYIQTRAFGHPNFAIVIVSGPDAREAAFQGQLIPFALEQVVLAFGSSVKQSFDYGASSQWNTSRLSQGSYSFARPTHLSSRTMLQAPFGNQVYFAGEAAVIAAHSAAHGAFIAGHYQALKALKSL